MERELKNDELIDEMNRLAPDECFNCESLFYDDDIYSSKYIEKKNICDIKTWCLEFDMGCYDCLSLCLGKKRRKL